jgi:hypothetical protein
LHDFVCYFGDDSIFVWQNFLLGINDWISVDFSIVVIVDYGIQEENETFGFIDSHLLFVILLLMKSYYLGHTKSSGADTIKSLRRLEKIFFLHILIARIELYNSRIIHHSSSDIIKAKFRYIKVYC